VRFTRPAAYTAAHRAFAAGLLCLGIAAAAYGALQVTLGPRSAYIHVRWAPDVPDAIRRESERRYGLAQGELLEATTWGYTLSDVSRTNVRTLVDDAVIEDTDGIQRDSGRITRSARRFSSPPTSHAWIPAGLLGLAVLSLCIGLICLGLGLIERSAPGRIATWFVHPDRAGPCRPRWASWFYQPEEPEIRGAEPGRPRLWGVVAVALSLPLLILVCGMLWSVPYTLSESVATFETVSRLPATSFLLPSSSYYRPLFYMTMSTLWHGTASLDGALTAVRFVHIVPVTMLVLLLIWHVRPRTPIDAAAAIVAVTVLVGSPGFIDNLELPLSYTIVGMAAALLVWMLVERDRRAWHGPAIVALTLVAIGFKEHGLVLVPLVMVAWWVGSPGVGRATAATVAGIGVSYVVFRLSLHDPSLPLFEQEIGMGFGALSPSEAEARFGAFPLWIYAYSAASTVATVLFAEPTSGVFRILRAWSEGQPQPWHFVHLVSSGCLTALIVWWGGGTMVRTVDRAWSPEARLFIVTTVVLVACGSLSFNYSRDRLGGMAVVFYALAAYAAVRAAGNRATHAAPATAAVTGLVVLLIAGSWQLRALSAIEFGRNRAVSVQQDWMTELYPQRVEYADQPEYLRIMREMTDQSTDPTANKYTPYPRWMVGMLGEF
jgi:hypothetical protein